MSFHDLIENPLSLEIELTTRCNSRCVGCSRYSNYFFQNPYLDPRVDIETEVLKKLFDSVSRLDFVLLCGVYGDPFWHPDIEEILDSLRSRHEKVRLSVHTNGAYRPSAFWSRIAKHFMGTGSHVKFSLDGFKNSHELFRKGTQWEIALENAKTFIQGGGNAIWQMIEFDHNRYEVEDVRKFALNLGFKRFEVRKNNFPGLDKYIQQEKTPISQVLDLRRDSINPATLDEWNIQQIKQKVFKVIQCRSLERKSVYIDAYGRVWPCCWVGGLLHRPEHELRQWMRQKLTPRYGKDFNSLKLFSFREILCHEWFRRDLAESWSRDGADPINPLMATCAKTCGTCLEK